MSLTGDAASGEKQAIEVPIRPLIESYSSSARIDRRYADSRQQLDGVLIIEFARPQRDPFFLRFTSEIVLRKIGTIVRDVGFGTDHGDVAVISPTPHYLRRGIARRACTDDNNRLRRLSGRWADMNSRRSVGQLRLARDEDHPVTGLYFPARDGSQRGRAQRLARPEAEASVVPWAPDRVTDNDPLAERRSVVGAARSGGKEFLAVSYEQDTFAPDVTDEHAAISDRGSGHATREIGPHILGALIFGHFQTPPVEQCIDHSAICRWYARRGRWYSRVIGDGVGIRQIVMQAEAPESSDHRNRFRSDCHDLLSGRASPAQPLLTIRARRR